MVDDPIDTVLDEFETWSKDTNTEIRGNGDDARLLLQLLRDHLGVEHPHELGAGNLTELLLDVYPRKVTVFDRADAADVIPTVRDLLAFVGETGGVEPRSFATLEREVDTIEPDFLDEVMDPDNWGVARSLMQAMAADGVDVEDQQAMERWIAGYNANLPQRGPGAGRDDEADVDFAEAFGLPDRLPPLRLSPQDDRAAAARMSPLLRRARQLGSWLGDGRDLTEDGDLTVADAVAAARALDIEVPVEDAEALLPGMPPKPMVRGLWDLPELVRLWAVAEAVEFIDSDDDRARPGEAMRRWPDGGDDDVLDVWTSAFGYLLQESLCLDARIDGDAELDFHPLGGLLAVTLFLARGEGVARAELSETAREAATMEGSSTADVHAWKTWNRRHGDPVLVLLGRLEEHGAVVIDGDVARLTPLAMSAMRDQLAIGGIEAPLLPPVEEMTAADLVSVAEGAAEEELADEAAAWTALRSPEDAARELLDVAATGSAPERVTATSIAIDLGARAEPVWRDALDRDGLRPYAKMALSRIREGEPAAGATDLEPGPEDAAWLLTDVLAAALVAGPPDELAEQMREALPPGDEEAAFGVMWRLPHPDAYDVLSAVGKHHPNKKIAKAARKAAFKANSRR